MLIKSVVDKQVELEFTEIRSFKIFGCTSSPNYFAILAIFVVSKVKLGTFSHFSVSSDLKCSITHTMQQFDELGQVNILG